jgi:hypothetical protein
VRELLFLSTDRSRNKFKNLPGKSRIWMSWNLVEAIESASSGEEEGVFVVNEKSTAAKQAAPAERTSSLRTRALDQMFGNQG